MGRTKAKFPEAKKTASGNWRCRVMVDGVTHSITNPDKRTAEKEAYQLKMHLKEVKRVKDKIVTLRELCQQWIDKNEWRLSPSTVAGYYVIMRNRAQVIMDMPAKQITQRRWDESVEEDRKRLAGKTLKNTYTFLSKVLDEMAGVKFVTEFGHIESKSREWLEPEEIETLLKVIRGHEIEIPVLLALSSLRRSELLAVTWDNVDLRHGMLKVEGAAVADKNNKLVYKSQNKTKKSNRYVPIIEPLQIALEEQEDKTGLVCKGANTHIAARINTVLRNSGLPEVGCHGLRHSFASLCYYLRVKPKIAQEIGGWEDSGTMEKIYTHIAQKDREHYSGQFLDFFSSDKKTEAK